MMSRKDIELLLKANGLMPTAPDEKVRSVLLSAHWDEDEIETALYVLREKKTTHEQRVDSVHTFMYSDQKLSTEAVKSLLNYDMEANFAKRNEEQAEGYRLHVLQYFALVILGLILATTGVVFMMYQQDVGIFHESMSIVS